MGHQILFGGEQMITREEYLGWSKWRQYKIKIKIGIFNEEIYKFCYILLYDVFVIIICLF